MQPLKPYNRMQMQLASNSVLSQPPLAAMPQLSEKPRLGFATKKTAWNPGPNVCNFTVTLGLQVVVSENGVRETYSARYYNPLTGRFLSRDPEDGSKRDPKSLHKYLYAGGEPVNATDPSGRAELVATAELDFWQAVKDAALATATAAAISCAYFKVSSAVHLMVQYSQSFNQLFSTGLCSYGSECEQLVKDIYRYMNTISQRIDDLLIDWCDLYNKAYDVPNPSLPGGCAGTTWVGHQQQVLGWQQGLRNLLKEAERKGCLIPPGAWDLATRPIPSQPRGN